jgi:hypothetical protein
MLTQRAQQFSSACFFYWCCWLPSTHLRNTTAEDLPRTGEGRCNEDIGAVPHTTPVYTDPYGKTHGGVLHMRYLLVFRIETDTKFYELEGKKK